ncbi:MAG: 4-alpha-glucanotransferase, partial [Rhizobiaceae bacterium]
DHAFEVRRQEIETFDQLTGVESDDPDDMYIQLGKTGSNLAALQIEDILGVEAQPNLPGTIHEYPNWRQRLPIGAQEFADEPRISHAAQIMKASGR